MTTVLVIDDDRHMRAACGRALAKAGWLVVSAETGDEGIERLKRREQNFDAVLLDQLMPGITGVEALAEIHAIDPNLPVVIMTGSITDDDAKAMKKQGAFDCLPKPFTPDELREMIKKAVEKT
jgi:DNA-binding NtrC family response regulator